ncbi:hypothetical protein HNO53_13080 [Billgrantia antri]|uniref:DUF2442 domain-containing protein n=1 Tax=Halomonas sulfidivorans TaxID=2733488 RepID=A0ABX7WH56_9GAMM|nr:hypothetical protein [Halomonas sulfidivorans]QTP59569.1 hypothetical protein HNO53_13080 [Halomonas sulfidivorans]
MMIELKRHGESLTIYVDDACLKVPDYYAKKPFACLTRCQRREQLQHDLHMASGWLAPAIHIDAILAAADALNDGWTAKGEIQ